MARAYLVAALLAPLVLLTPALQAEEAAEEVRPHTDAQLEEHRVFAEFDERFRSNDMDDRIRALRRLAHWRHEGVVKRLQRIWEREENLELKAAAAAGLGNQVPFARTAGKTLVRGLVKMKDFASREDPQRTRRCSSASSRTCSWPPSARRATSATRRVGTTSSGSSTTRATTWPAR